MATSPLCSLRSRRHDASGFTLVEVALAIGIVAFAFVALMALLPAGQTAFRQAIDVAVTGQIGQRILNEAQMSDFQSLIDMKNLSGGEKDNFTFRAPLVMEPRFRYFDDQGREVIPRGEIPTPQEQKKIIYQVNTRIMPRATLPARRTAPRRETPGVGVPSQPLAQVTVQVALNPGGVKLKISDADPSSDDPMRNLWVKTKETAGIQIYTYSALVGRNE